MLAYLDMMSGGALSRCTLFALGVTPYINASIIVQLLTVAIPSLENLAKEPDGQQKLQQITRYAGGQHCSDHEHRLLLRDPQYGRTEVHLRRGWLSLPPCHHRHLHRQVLS